MISELKNSDDKGDNGMFISPQEIVARHDISYQTLNYYTTLGLLIVRKRRRNSRLYHPEEVKKNLQRIEELKDQGYPLRLICKML